MEERNVPETQNIAEEETPKNIKKNKKVILIAGGVGLIIVLLVLAFFLLPRPSEIQWFSNKMIAI